MSQSVQEAPMRSPFWPLPRVLTNSDQPRWLYVLKAWALSYLGCIPLAAIVSWAVDNPPAPDFGDPNIGMFAAVVLFAPVAETLLMAPPVLILNRLLGPLPAVLGSAFLWGLAHHLAEPGWGYVIWWPFLVFSTILLVWRDKGLWPAMAMVMATHALQNSIPALALLFGIA